MRDVLPEIWTSLWRSNALTNSLLPEMTSNGPPRRRWLPVHSAPIAPQAINRAIMEIESNWLISDGIPGRPWFKHSLYAARYTYAHLELPGITEAVEKQDWKTAREQAAFLENALVKNTALLRQATKQLKATQ